jgi:hypothetical protein
MRNLKKLLNLLLEERSITTMYHVTETKNVASILEHGLDPKRRSKMSGFTNSYGGMAMQNYYDSRPLFFGIEPWGGEDLGDEFTTLQVDVSGIPLAADTPTVVEMIGSKLGQITLEERDKDGNITWQSANKEAIKLFMPYARKSSGDGDSEFVLLFDDLATANSPVALTAIDFTGTAACYEKISPDRIKIL